MKYRKKPVVIEAIQWTGENFKELAEFLGISEAKAKEMAYVGTELCIPSVKGDMRVIPTDMIIRDSEGNIFPCKKDVFDLEYELGA